MEVMRMIWELSRPGLTGFQRWGVYSNSLEVQFGMFQKRISKEFAPRSRETPVNSLIKNRGNCMYHARQCTEFSMNSCICLRIKCR
jgi:hypothetical protein